MPWTAVRMQSTEAVCAPAIPRSLTVPRLHRMVLMHVIALLESRLYEDAEELLSSTTAAAVLSHTSLLYLRVRACVSRGTRTHGGHNFTTVCNSRLTRSLV